MLNPSLRMFGLKVINAIRSLDYKPSKLDKGNDKLCIVTRGNSHFSRG